MSTTKQRQEGHIGLEDLKKLYDLRHPNGPFKFYFKGNSYDLDDIHPTAAEQLVADPQCKFLVAKGPKKADAAAGGKVDEPKK